MLSEMGCRVTEAANGLEGIAAAEQGGEFDLALLDFVMPGLNGGETAQRLRALAPGLRVILMSGFADTEALAAVWSGPLLQKPFSAARLALQITGLTDRMGEAAAPTAIG
jgi:CheY-like chemotaxis protein